MSFENEIQWVINQNQLKGKIFILFITSENKAWNLSKEISSYYLSV
jgi:hypothetical protein